MRYGTGIHFHWARVPPQVSGIRPSDIGVVDVVPSIRAHISHEFPHYISLVQA